MGQNNQKRGCRPASFDIKEHKSEVPSPRCVFSAQRLEYNTQAEHRTHAYNWTYSQSIFDKLKLYEIFRNYNEI